MSKQQNYKFGEVRNCSSCKLEIMYDGRYWEHLNGNSRHVAVPKKLPDSFWRKQTVAAIKQLEEGKQFVLLDGSVISMDEKMNVELVAGHGVVYLANMTTGALFNLVRYEEIII